MLPVIPSGTRSAVVTACLNRSELWHVFQVFHLTANVRVGPELYDWSQLLLRIGEGTVPEKFPIPSTIRQVSTIHELISAVFPRMDRPDSFKAKAILTPLNVDV